MSRDPIILSHSLTKCERLRLLPRLLCGEWQPHLSVWPSKRGGKTTGNAVPHTDERGESFVSVRSSEDASDMNEEHP